MAPGKFSTVQAYNFWIITEEKRDAMELAVEESVNTFPYSCDSTHFDNIERKGVLNSPPIIESEDP